MFLSFVAIRDSYHSLACVLNIQLIRPLRRSYWGAVMKFSCAWGLCPNSQRRLLVKLPLWSRDSHVQILLKDWLRYAPRVAHNSTKDYSTSDEWPCFWWVQAELFLISQTKIIKIIKFYSAYKHLQGHVKISHHCWYNTPSFDVIAHGNDWTTVKILERA